MAIEFNRRDDQNEHDKYLLHRLDLERIEKMTWQFNKQLCFTVALLSVLITASTAPLVVADATPPVFGDEFRVGFDVP